MNKTVILYTTGCPKCKVLKQKLDAKGIEYSENNSKEEMLDMGLTSVPVLGVNQSLLDFKEAVEWINNQ